MHCGGAERVAANLANHWANKGWNVSIVTLASIEMDFYELHPTVRCITLNLTRDSSNPLAAVVNNLRRITTLRRVLRAVQPDIALAMSSRVNVLLALAAIGMRDITTIRSEHGHPPHWPLGTVWETLRAGLYGHLAGSHRLDERVLCLASSAHPIPKDRCHSQCCILPPA